jgi:hypothetical protein
VEAEAQAEGAAGADSPQRERETRWTMREYGAELQKDRTES